MLPLLTGTFSLQVPLQLLDVLSTIGLIKQKQQMFAQSLLAYLVMITRPNKSHGVNNKHWKVNQKEALSNLEVPTDSLPRGREQENALT